jgi:hypothetical protein
MVKKRSYLAIVLLVYKKLTKIKMPIITARNKMTDNMSTKRIPIPTAIPVHLSSLLAEFYFHCIFESPAVF